MNTETAPLSAVRVEPVVRLPLMEMVKNLMPPPHCRCIVGRNGRPFVATACYGIHEPLWIAMTAIGEDDPVSMDDEDVWAILQAI